MTRIWAITAVCFVVGLSADLYFGATRPGLTASIGFFGCGLIVFGSKFLGAWLLQRPEAYYVDADEAGADRPGGPRDA